MTNAEALASMVTVGDLQSDGTCNAWMDSADRRCGKPAIRQASTSPSRPNHLRLRASNGAILAHSESYPSPANAHRARKALLRAFAEVLIREGWIEAEQVKWGAP